MWALSSNACIINKKNNLKQFALTTSVNENAWALKHSPVSCPPCQYSCQKMTS